MSLMHKVRIYHAALAVLTVLAYFSGDFGIVHDWLGYGVAIIIALRLLWAVFNPRQLGLNRFYPAFDGLHFDNFYRHPAVSKTLILAIALSLCGATLTGVAMDGGAAIGLAEVKVVGTALANGHNGSNDGGGNGGGGEFLEDIHELFSNFLIFFVILHAGYLLLFKRPLARFMLYRDRSK